jgi:hypothetical protein
VDAQRAETANVISTIGNQQTVLAQNQASIASNQNSLGSKVDQSNAYAVLFGVAGIILSLYLAKPKLVREYV